MSPLLEVVVRNLMVHASTGEQLYRDSTLCAEKVNGIYPVVVSLYDEDRQYIGFQEPLFAKEGFAYARLL